MTKKHSNEIIDKDLIQLLNLEKIQKIFENYEEDNNYRVKVYKCEDKDGKKFALKTCNSYEFFEQEIKAIEKIKESKIYISSFTEGCSIVVQELTKRKKYAIKMPLMIEFEDFKANPEYNVKVNVYARQLLNQLHFLHKAGILHGDIKEDNIMYHSESDELCIIDFGLSLIIEDEVEEELKDLDFYDVNRRLDPPNEIFNSFYKSPEILTEENLDEYNDWLQQTDDIGDKIEENGGLEIYKNFRDLEDELDSCSNDSRIDEIEKELEEMEKEVEKLGYSELFDAYADAEENMPDAAEVIDFHEEEVIDECPLAFGDHITIYCDVYALGKMIMLYLDIDDIQQEEFLEKMVEPDIHKRISSKDILNVSVFNVLKNDESVSTEI